MTRQHPEPRPERSAPAAGGDAKPSSNGYDPLNNLKAAASNVGEVGAYARQFISAKISGLLYGVRKLALLSMLGAVLGIAGISFLVTCAVLFVLGISGAVEAVLPEHLDWLGKMIVGAGGVLIAMLAVYIILRRATTIGKRMALEQYKTSLREQRKQFGHDAFSRSAADAAEREMKARSARARTRDEAEELRQKQVKAEKAQQQIGEDFVRIRNQ